MRELDLLYAEGFVAKAMEDGLSKEATAELLMHASVQRGNPDYAAGFYAHGTRPVLTADDFEKSAAFGKNLGNVGKGLWGATKGVGGMLKDLVTGAGSGARKFIGPAQQVRGGAPVQPWVARNPRTAFALGAGGAAGTVALGHRLLSDPSAGSPFVPTLAGDGSYDAAGAKARQEGLSEATSKGVFDLNKQLNNGVARQEDLEKAVLSGGPESHLALGELQKMKADRSSAGNIKMRHARELDAAGNRLRDMISIQDRQRQSLQDARDGRGGVGGFMRRLWYNMNGDGLSADDELDAKLLRLQGQRSNLSSAYGLVRDQQMRLGSGSTAAVRVPSPAQVQRDFFPTYQ